MQSHKKQYSLKPGRRTRYGRVQCTKHVRTRPYVYTYESCLPAFRCPFAHKLTALRRVCGPNFWCSATRIHTRVNCRHCGVLASPGAPLPSPPPSSSARVSSATPFYRSSAERWLNNSCSLWVAISAFCSKSSLARWVQLQKLLFT